MINKLPALLFIPVLNGTKLSPSGTSAMRQFIESEEEGWFGIG
jgi:hypothetical protein